VAQAEFVGVGSILEDVPEHFPGLILGAGLMHEGSTLRLPRARILALRGSFTRERIVSARPRVLGDPGLLAPRLAAVRVKPEFPLGIVPHYVDKESPYLQAVTQLGADQLLMIDVERPPAAVIADIARCETILSSSLHGIVVADALGISNRWLYSDRVLGRGFKFRDYYSALDATRSPAVITGSESLDQLQQMALAPPEKVQTVASELSDLFRELADASGATRASPSVFTGTAMAGMEIRSSAGDQRRPARPSSAAAAVPARPDASPRRIERWRVGVTVTERPVRTLERTLSSLQAAGFPAPRIFADGPVIVPEALPLSRRSPAVGGWPNFWLALTEMISRDPAADAYLIVQDDVVFCRNLVPYIRQVEIPDDCGAVSLFCPACYNGPFGWHTTEVGYGLAGAQALAFPRERAFEFLAHPWTVNHRRSCPKSEHYRGDGLHHIDGVVGEWCRRTRLRVYTHSPSLSQHIGNDSVMYPDFQGKPHRRFADTFPGEDVDALGLAAAASGTQRVHVPASP
jgi:pyruvyltransferase